MTCLAVIFLFSCNPANQVLRNQAQFEKVGQKWMEKNPCVNDSIAIYIPGKKDSIYIEIPSGISGDEHLSVVDLLDSVRRAADYIDATCQPRIEAAYRKGYQTAIGRVKTIKIAVPIRDTVKVIVKDRQFAKVIESNLKAAQDILKDKDGEVQKMKGKRDSWFWAFLLTLLLLICSSYIQLNKIWR